jgi:p-aminobenzoyl-glutamate transporter AbgT
VVGKAVSAVRSRGGSWFFFIELLTMALLPVASWIASIYLPPTRSLLDANGLRWLMTHWVDNFTRLPVGEAVLVLIGLSALQTSGLASLGHRHLSLKQKRAMLFTLASLFAVVMAVAAMTLLPPYILLNFFGGVAGSPLADSLPGLLFIMVEVASCVYGFTSGKIVTVGDFSQAHSSLLVRFAPCFVHFFLLAQIIAWIKYSYFL